MRHGKKVNHLSRTHSHRKALMANMASSLIEHKRIQTTLAKAKALRQYVEPIVTKAKNNTTHSRRIVFSYLQNKSAVQELFDNIAGKVADRPGGYLRIIRIGFRQGDAAEMALIEFVDYNETYTVEKKAGSGSKKKRTRRGGSKAKSEDAPKAAAATPAAAPAAEPAPADEPQAIAEDVVAEEVESPAAEAAGEVVEDVADEVTEAEEVADAGDIAEEAAEGSDETENEEDRV